MKPFHVLDRIQSRDSAPARKPISWILSPLRPRITNEVVHVDEQSEERVFLQRDEPNNIELFYDLFFVANLTSFTSNQEIKDGPTLKNYLGFFSLLWFTWLQTSLYDVRFSKDSFLHRFSKTISLGVMIGFGAVGVLYNVTEGTSDYSLFSNMALILTISRFALAVQYGVMLCYAMSDRRTVIPLCGTIATLLVSAMLFFGTYLGYEFGQDRALIYIAWYIMSLIEAVAVISISCFWPVLSFKDTCVVGRLGLLTLIIMGEGIIGMNKSVSTILLSFSYPPITAVVTVVASILLIYFIWALYFDQFDYDQFEKIQDQLKTNLQQFGIILIHFPLHVAILLTVEGSTTLTIWNAVLYGFNPLQDWPLSDFASVYNSTSDLINSTHSMINQCSKNFKNVNASAIQECNATLYQLWNITAAFNSTPWEEQAENITENALECLIGFVFDQLDVKSPKSKENLSSFQADQRYDIFETVFYYFFISAGFFLVILAMMYWILKTNKLRGIYGSITLRLIAGLGVTIGFLSALNINSSYYFNESIWMIPTVTLSFFVVFVIDNIIVWYTYKPMSERASNDRPNGYELVRPMQGNHTESA